MVTKNFKNMLAMALESSSLVYGSMVVHPVATYAAVFAVGTMAFPGSRTEAFTLDPNAAGISIGTDGTAATEDDRNLGATVTSGVTVTLTTREVGCDSPGNPYILFRLTITNTSGNTLIIREVGYKQNIKSAVRPGMTSAIDAICLLDRTVLDTPLTIPNGDAGVLVYKLKTNPVPEKTVSGVKIVSWEYGTDAEIADMLDAAAAGTIDLQTDGGWHVGDVRKIHMDAWTGGNNVSHAAQDIEIGIAQFGDYNSCGCKMQFDFMDAVSGNQRMNSSNTTTGGYGATEMYTTTLPAMVNALPGWLRTRLKTFSVVATKGANSTELETISNNKLALRSASEVFGSGHNAKAAEGDQIALYKFTGHRVKCSGMRGSTVYWWERSPNSGSNFCYVTNNGTANNTTASNAYGVSPFGCI